MREIRMLRTTWRKLETGLRDGLRHRKMAKTSGQQQLPVPVATAPAFDPTGERRLETEPWGSDAPALRKPPATATPIRLPLPRQSPTLPFSATDPFRLVEGRYVPIPVTATEGGILVGHSEVLGLELRLTPDASVRDVLRFYDPMIGEPLRSLRKAERRLDEEAQAHGEAERGRDEEAQAREEAEARLRQTQERLRDLEIEIQALHQRGR